MGFSFAINIRKRGLNSPFSDTLIVKSKGVHGKEKRKMLIN
jgi:hypothetical protein